MIIAPAPVALKRAKILMVDQEPKNLLALEGVLEGLGHELVRAESREEALRCLLNEDFAMVLLDVQLAAMDGFKLAELVRSRQKDNLIPIIFLSAVGRTEAEMFRAYEVGALDYLVRPFAPAVLRSKVRVLIDLSQKAQEIERLNVQLKATNALLALGVQERTSALEARGMDLMRSNEELAQFAMVASHDLQEPLRTLSTYLQMIQENNQARFSGEDSEFFQVVLDAAKRMRALINDLLAFSQVGQLERQLVPVDCGLLVEDVVGSLQKMAEERASIVKTGPLPTILGEPRLLARVFQNLIENGLKFQGEAKGPILVSAERSGPEWVFAVKDHGIGIAPEHFEKIFKLFQRLHSRDAYPGTGMGLAITKKIVERHGGRIWLESPPGQGTTFFFSLPA
jgi:signal transduction histidine kinase